MNNHPPPQPQQPSTKHRGWYSRGYLPHFDMPSLIQSITFRLVDSLPAHVLEAMANERERLDDRAWRQQIEDYLDAGYGACYLRQPEIATLVEEALHYFDGQRYRLLAWVVMPNHVHVLIETFVGYLLDKVVHSWKSYTANEANNLLGRNGRFWYREYFDRYIRDERHYGNVVRYIHHNPVKAGLVEEAVDWPYSSARLWMEK